MNSCKNILVALVVIACGLHRGGAQAPTCPADGSEEVCFSCLAKGDCSVPDAPAEEGDKCAAGEACKVVGGVATCMPVANVPDCACGGGSTGCDAYDPLVSIFCVKVGSSKRLFKKETCVQPEKCVEGKCEETSSSCEDASLTGYFPVTPECSSAIFCAEGEEITTEECTAGQFFNTESAACEAYPPNPCANCDKPRCPVITDCSKYVVCSNGEVIDEDESCEGEEVFDPVTGVCGEGPATGTCVQYAECNFELIAPDQGNGTNSNETASGGSSSGGSGSGGSGSGGSGSTDTNTTKPSCNAANANTRYPHDTNCKKYYTCRLVTRTSYRYVESTCSGSLVFNPETRYCDLPSEVPDCVPPQ